MKAVTAMHSPFRVGFAVKSEDGAIHRFYLAANSGLDFLMAVAKTDTSEKVLKEFARWGEIGDQKMAVNSARSARRAMDDSRMLLLESLYP